jgi:flagellar protein FliO/FliZ
MQAVTLIFLFVALVALGGVAIWLVRRFANSRLGANTNRGRLPRLAVIDAAAVDGRRRLVLIRRDNVEHLLMIGGPTDIVVEPNIIRAAARGDQLPQRPAGAEPPPRIALPEAGWAADNDGARTNGFDHPEPQMPEPPPRPARPSFADEVRRTASALSERRGDPLTGFSPESLGGRAEPRAEPPRMEPRSEPMPPRMPRSEPLIPRPPRQTEPSKAPPVRAAERAAVPPPSPPPPPAQAADQNLAEMAQRLEAALRRPAGTPAEAPSVAPEPPPSRAARGEPPVAPSAPVPSPKSSFENLEEEMASLLGRPKSSSS